jgi:hypothetical protein
VLAAEDEEGDEHDDKNQPERDRRAKLVPARDQATGSTAF